jgi:glycosyltransferase involved in cell wall biosynthesis
MKFSVLLPTRNGGPYLRGCISSVLDEDYDDMELVVCDNANVDETQEVLASFSNDHRLKVLRTEEVLSVTDNWNKVYQASSGDYILMLGDDDCLIPGYFNVLEKILEEKNYPELITHNYCSFIEPNSIDGNKYAYYNYTGFKYGQDFRSGEEISREMRSSMVRDMFRFRTRFPLQIQATLFSRKAAKRVKGDLFQVPYPDFYALCSMLLTAQTWVFSSKSLLVVGVTPHSHGAYQFSSDQDQESKGLDYIGVSEVNKDNFGSPTFAQVLVWLDSLKVNYAELLENVEVCHSNYLLRQIYYSSLEYKKGNILLRDFVKRFSQLSFLEILGLFRAGLVNKDPWKRLWRAVKYFGNHRVQKIWVGCQPLESHITDMKGFAHWIGKRSSVFNK